MKDIEATKEPEKKSLW